ncbi:MAG: MFS transporter [Verrucomicrobiales bacterium]|nr:MFS transporter [Verrucomicrobiales bacterium]
MMKRRWAGWHWWVTGLLLLATMINYMDRVTLANASVRVTTDFGMSDQDYGDLEVAFGWAFAAGSLVFGFLADRFRVYGLYPVVLTGWSLAGMASGWVEGSQGLLLCRVLLGFFEAGHWPCALKVTHAVLTDGQRTLGNSILQSGASIGAVITPQVMRMLMTDEPGSWRSAFVVVGGVGLGWVLLWLLVMRPRDLEGSTEAVKTGPSEAVAEGGLMRVLLSRRFAAVALLIVGAQTVWHVFRVWLMKFLQTGRGYEEAVALNFNSVYYVATDLGCFAAGFVSLWLVRKWGLSAHGARRWVYAGGCGLTSLSLLLPGLQRGPVLLAVLLLIGAGSLALFPCYYSFVQELSARHVGRLTGLLSMWVWAVTSPMHRFFGMLADRTGSYDQGLMLAGLVPWIGVIAMAILWGNETRRGSLASS